MKDMSAWSRKVIGTGFMLAMMLAAVTSIAQEPASDDELLPAVDTSAAVNEEEESGLRASEATRTSAENRVMDSMQLGRTEITGNQELPKVLYIVPWQKSDPGDLMGKPVNTLMDEVLAPIDREEFLRQVNYYGDLQGEEKDP